MGKIWQPSLLVVTWGPLSLWWVPTPKKFSLHIFFFLTYGLIVRGVFKGSLSRLSEILALVWLPWHKSILGGLRCLWLGYCISIFFWRTSYDNGMIFIGNYVYILLFSTLGTVVLRSTNMPNCLTSLCPSHVGHMHDMILFGHMSNMPKYVSFFFFSHSDTGTLLGVWTC